MKFGEHIPGIYFDFQGASIEVMRAQRMAELEQMAKYRAIKLQQYKDWSDPVKRAAIKAQYKVDEAIGRAKLVDIPADQVAVRTGEVPFEVMKLTVIYPEIKSRKTIWQRFEDWVVAKLGL